MHRDHSPPPATSILWMQPPSATVCDYSARHTRHGDHDAVQQVHSVAVCECSLAVGILVAHAVSTVCGSADSRGAGDASESPERRHMRYYRGQWLLWADEPAVQDGDPRTRRSLWWGPERNRVKVK